MKKQLLALILAMLLSIPSFAIESRSQIPTLTFSGTTATCQGIVSSSGARIEAELTLWHGNTIVDSWSKSGNNYVLINETCRVSDGETYTLTLTGTINGVEFTETSVTRTC